jgi:hypothetical protein
VDSDVMHDAFDHDPHPIADKLTAYWESEGFTVLRTVDSKLSSGWMGISIRATRPDGVFYGLTATSDLVAIDVSSECSTHPSIDTWAEKRVEDRWKSLQPTPSEPSPSPAADAVTDDRFWGFWPGPAAPPPTEPLRPVDVS